MRKRKGYELTTGSLLVVPLWTEDAEGDWHCEVDGLKATVKRLQRRSDTDPQYWQFVIDMGEEHFPVTGGYQLRLEETKKQCLQEMCVELFAREEEARWKRPKRKRTKKKPGQKPSN